MDGTRKAYLADLGTVPLLIIADLDMRKLRHTAAEDLLELIMRRYMRPARGWAMGPKTVKLSRPVEPNIRRR